MKGFKKILSYSLALAISVSLVGCSASAPNSKENVSKNKLEQVEESGKLVVGMSAEYPPYEFHKMIDGKDTIVGFDAMISEAIAKDLGVEVEFKDMDFDGLIGALNANKVDLILSGMTPTEERKKNVDFSQVYYKETNSALVKKGDEGKVKSDEDLKKLKIGVQKGSIQENYVLNTLKCSNVKSLAKIPDLVLDLQNGNIDAIVVSTNVAHINAGKYDGIASVDGTIAKDLAEGAAVAFKKQDNNKELVDAVSKKLDDLIKTGELDKFVDEARKLAQ